MNSFQPVLSSALSPSASRSRSRSPVKKVLHQLRESGIPRIVVDSKSVRKDEDIGAYSLLRNLVNAPNFATIPREINVDSHSTISICSTADAIVRAVLSRVPISNSCRRRCLLPCRM